MSRQVINVYPDSESWRIATDEEQGDTDMPLYNTKEDAIAAAILSAENANEEGQHAQVMVKDTPDADYRLVRSFDGT